MAELNAPLKESYIGKVGDALKPYAAELTAKGFDPAERIATLTGAGEKIEAAGKVRTQAEGALADAIKEENTVRDGFYTQAASTVSLVEGLLTKTHPLTVKLRSLRADLIGNQNPDGSDTPAPAATKPA